MNIQFRLATHGFEVFPNACGGDLLEALRQEFPTDAEPDFQLADTSRNVRDLLAHGFFRRIAESILGEDCFATHAILYNRTAANNTPQVWHQDTQIRIAGNDAFEAPEDFDFGRLLSLRLSLDDSTFLDGGLKLCPASHVHGRLTEREVRGHSIRPFSSPEMKAGDLLAMHPLTIHASGASQTLRPRRVIHAVYAVGDLPAPLSWAARI